MRIFDLYIFKNLLISALFITIILTVIVFLTQSLRFLEIVLNAGSSGSAFWGLTALALPRFMEVILPLSIMGAILFLYNKMTMDSELIAMRAIGHSPLSLARPGLVLSAMIFVILLVISFWVAPNAASEMRKMRFELGTQLSTALFREGIFNPLGNGLTVYIRSREANGELSGLMIHDTRKAGVPPSTVFAKRGMIVAAETGQQVIVFDGTRDEFDPRSGVLQRLAFDRYTIDLPESESIQEGWLPADERNIGDLLFPNMEDARDKENLRQFQVEIHKRLTSSMLALVFALIALNTLLLGPVDRRGQIPRIVTAIFAIVLIQGLFIAISNIARQSNAGIVLMYAISIIPTLVCFALLTENGRNQILSMIPKARKRV